MKATKSPIPSDPSTASDGAPGRITWAFAQTGCTTRLGRMGSCGTFVHPWCTARGRSAKRFRLAAPQGKCATRLHCRNSFDDWGADFLRPWSAINERWWCQNAPELRLASCFTQDSGSASSNAARSSCFEVANRQPDSAAANRTTESQILNW